MPQTPLNQTSPFTYKHLANAGTTTLKSVGGTLKQMILNSVGSSATITLYDNTAASGTVIAIASATTATTAPLATVYDVTFLTGLTVVITGTVDVTITIR